MSHYANELTSLICDEVGDRLWNDENEDDLPRIRDWRMTGEGEATFYFEGGLEATVVVTFREWSPSAQPPESTTP